MVASPDRLRTAGRNAFVTRLGSDLRASFNALADTSTVMLRFETGLETLRGFLNDSGTVRLSNQGMDVFTRFAQESRAVSLGDQVVEIGSEPVRNAIDRATLTDVSVWLLRSARSSWLYRWLTAEPEPEVIVIDLRETLSVGPIIAGLDRALRTLVPASHRSSIRILAESFHSHVKDAPVRIASVFLFIAILTSLMLSLIAGEPTQAGVIGHVVLLGMAALGTRVQLTWAELVETRAAKLLVAALEPPEPPEEFDDRDG